MPIPTRTSFQCHVVLVKSTCLFHVVHLGAEVTEGLSADDVVGMWGAYRYVMLHMMDNCIVSFARVSTLPPWVIVAIATRSFMWTMGTVVR